MKTSNLFLLNTSILILMLLFSAGCKKNEDFTQFDLLTTGDWQLIDKKQEDQSILQACEKDNLLILKADNTFERNFGLIFCENEAEFDNGILEGDWKIKGEGMDLRFSYKIQLQTTKGSVTEYWEISQLSGDTLVIQENYEGGAPLITEIYVKK